MQSYAYIRHYMCDHDEYMCTCIHKHIIYCFNTNVLARILKFRVSKFAGNFKTGVQIKLKLEG